MLKETEYKHTWLIRDEKIPKYNEYLESDEWQTIKARLRAIKKYQKCRACGKTRGIQLHHKTYKFVHTTKEESGIVPLCGKCHRKTHEYAKKKNVSVIRATRYVIARAKQVKPRKVKRNESKVIKKSSKKIHHNKNQLNRK